MADKIIELLKNSKLRTEITQTMAEIYSMTGTRYDNPDENMKDIADEDLYDAAWDDSVESERIEKAFEKYVFEKMREPYRMSFDEVIKIFFDMAKPEAYRSPDPDAEYADNVYTSFINYVKNYVLSYKHSAPFTICVIAEGEVIEEYLRGVMFGYQVAMRHVEGKELKFEALDADDSQKGKPLWDKNGVSVSLMRGAELIEERPMGKKLYFVLAFIEGKISALTLSNLLNEMNRILPSAVRSTDLLHTTGFGEYKVIEPEIPVIYDREIKGLPWIEDKLIESAKVIIRQYLDAYYIELTKKDSIQRRIRNAVHLMMESDAQSNDALGLSLAVTAIDALLGQKGKDISDKLADNVAVLLEPKLSNRSQATEFVRKLYDKRSRVLHGEKIEGERAARIQSRQLAAGVLSGMIIRRDFLTRMELEPESPQELFQLLREKRFEAGQPMGVWELNVRKLWGS